MRNAARLAAVAVCAAALPAAGPAAAWAGGEVRVEPREVRPGEVVRVSVPASCAGGAVVSAAFPWAAEVRLRPVPDGASARVEGEVRIDPAAEPGNQPVTVACGDGRTLTGRVVVVVASTGADTVGEGLAAPDGAGIRSGRDWGVAVTLGAGAVLLLGGGTAAVLGRRRRSGSDG